MRLHMATKTLPVSVRMAPEIKAATEEAAKRDRRSISAFIELRLEEWLAKNGYLPPMETASQQPKIAATEPRRSRKREQ